MEAVEFGEYLKKLRKNKGLTMKQFGESVDLSQPYLSQIESGQRGIPSPDILKKLSEGLGVEYTKLMEEAGYIEEPPTDLERIDNMIQVVQSKLRLCLEQKEAIIHEFGKLARDDEVNDPEEFKRLISIRNNNDKFIDAWENSLNEFLKLRAIVEKKQVVENLTMTIHDLINPKVELEFETPDLSKMKIPQPTNKDTNLPYAFESFLKNTHEKVYIENLFSTENELYLNGKRLSDKEKERAIQILNLAFDDTTSNK